MPASDASEHSTVSNTPPLPPPLFPREKKKDSPDLSSPLKGKLAHRWELWELVYQGPLPSHSRAPTLILVSLLSLSWRRKSQPTPASLPGESRGQRSLRAAGHGVTVGHDWATEQLSLCAPLCLFCAQQPGRSGKKKTKPKSDLVALRLSSDSPFCFKQKPRLSGQSWEAIWPTPLHSLVLGRTVSPRLLALSPLQARCEPSGPGVPRDPTVASAVLENLPSRPARLTPYALRGFCQPPSRQAFPPKGKMFSFLLNSPLSLLIYTLSPIHTPTHINCFITDE